MATSVIDTSKSGHALVLGGGGPVGRAWQSGLASGLLAEGIALGSADLILGTSAGAIVGAQLALGLDLANAGPPPGATPPPPPPGDAMGELARAMARVAASPTPDLERRAIGQFALNAQTPSEEQSIQRVGFLAGNDWPANFQATAVDAATGKAVVWSKMSTVPLERAVASSCALPGVWPPITIDGGRYIDGGVRSMLNADLASGYAAVLIMSCFALVSPPGPQGNALEERNAGLRAEIDSLRATGAAIDLLSPNEAFLELTQYGAKMLDGSLAPAAFRIGLEQGAQRAADLGDAWRQE